MENKFYEIVKNEQKDLAPMNRWIVKLQAASIDGAWERVVAALLAPDRFQINREDLAALKRFVDVGGKNLSGVFVEQAFTVSKVDELGRLEIRLNTSFVNPNDPTRPFVEDWSGTLQSVGEKFHLIGKLGKDDNREIRLSEIKEN